MKSNLRDKSSLKRFYVECTCRCNNILVFDIDIEDYRLATVSMHYDHRVGFFKRLWWGMQFIFRGKDLIMWDDIIINENNIHQLEEFINYAKEVYHD